MKFVIFAALIACLNLHAAPMPPAKELARNEVFAVYVGTREVPCMHRTALCPNKCDHAKTVAVFKVVRNDNYAKTVGYGDAKADVDDEICVDINMDVEGQSLSTLETIQKLNISDYVQLTQVHYYVRKEYTSYPVRPIVKLEIKRVDLASLDK